MHVHITDLGIFETYEPYLHSFCGPADLLPTRRTSTYLQQASYIYNQFSVADIVDLIFILKLAW